MVCACLCFTDMLPPNLDRDRVSGGKFGRRVLGRLLNLTPFKYVNHLHRHIHHHLRPYAHKMKRILVFFL